MSHFTSPQELNSEWKCGFTVGFEYIQVSELVADNIFLRNMKDSNLFLSALQQVKYTWLTIKSDICQLEDIIFNFSSPVFEYRGASWDCHAICLYWKHFGNCCQSVTTVCIEQVKFDEKSFYDFDTQLKFDDHNTTPARFSIYLLCPSHVSKSWVIYIFREKYSLPFVY